MRTLELVTFAVLVWWQIVIHSQLERIEAKLDAMNTCGPAEVVASGEGE